MTLCFTLRECWFSDKSYEVFPKPQIHFLNRLYTGSIMVVQRSWVWPWTQVWIHMGFQYVDWLIWIAPRCEWENEYVCVHGDILFGVYSCLMHIFPWTHSRCTVILTSIKHLLKGSKCYIHITDKIMSLRKHLSLFYSLEKCYIYMRKQHVQ